MVGNLETIHRAAALIVFMLPAFVLGCDTEQPELADAEQFRSHDGDDGHPNKKPKKCKPKQVGSDAGEEPCTAEGCACDEQQLDDCDPGLSCDAGTCTIPALLCGDGIVDGAELCDDGNTEDDDGCDADCTASGVQAIASGDFHLCALLDHGAVRCWGQNTGGQTGQGAPEWIGDDEPASAADNLPLPESVVSISAGSSHTCALSQTGKVYCWGYTASGAIGRAFVTKLGDDERLLGLTPTRVGGVATRLATSEDHTCALLDTGKIRCWGANTYGIFGYPAVTSTKIGDNELPESLGQKYVAISTSVVDWAAPTGDGDHACAVDEFGDWRCWGYNAHRQLGIGGTYLGVKDFIAAGLPDGTTIEQLVVGSNNTCARYSTGDMLCWGRNASGQLGRASTYAFSNYQNPNQLTPIDFGGEAIANIDFVGASRVCATTVGDQTYCWGYNANNQLGYGHTSNIGDDELPIDAGPLDFGGASLDAFAGSTRTNCALLDNDEIRCVGVNGGHMGLGHTDPLTSVSFAAAPSVPLF